MPIQIVDQIKPPTIIIDDTLQAEIPWGGKAGDISFNKIKIPPGLTLHKINIHYKNEGGNCQIVEGPTHTTYVMPDAAFSYNGIHVENISLDDYYTKGNYSISYIDLSNISSFIQTYVDSGNEITYTTNEDDSIITASGALYSYNSWESTNTFYVKSAETVDTKNP